jgi:lipoyl(octanoyl) transferase
MELHDWYKDEMTHTGTRRQQVPVIDLGLAPYLPVQELQRRLQSAVIDGASNGVLLLLEHEPVITLGSRGRTSDLRRPGMEIGRDPRGVTVVASERGGQATLHAPGQLVSYPVVPIPGHDLSRYVRRLEQILILVLEACGISAVRRKGHPGLYVDDQKIASIGLRCRRWVASHGTSLNVDVDLSLFDYIVSCGEPHLRQTSIAALTTTAPPMAEVKRLYCAAAEEVFGWSLGQPVGVAHAEVEQKLGMPTAGFEPATPGSGGQCSIP